MNKVHVVSAIVVVVIMLFNESSEAGRLQRVMEQHKSPENWASQSRCDEVQQLSMVDRVDFTYLAESLGKQMKLDSFDELYEFSLRLKAFSDRNKFITEEFLKRELPRRVFMIEYNSFGRRDYGALELVHRMLHTDPYVVSFLESFESGDWDEIMKIFGEYTSNKCHGTNDKVAMQRQLTEIAQDYLALRAFFEHYFSLKQQTKSC